LGQLVCVHPVFRESQKSRVKTKVHSELPWGGKSLQPQKNQKEKKKNKKKKQTKKTKTQKTKKKHKHKLAKIPGVGELRNQDYL